MLKGFGCPIQIEVVGRKYLNNTVRQDASSIRGTGSLTRLPDVISSVSKKLRNKSLALTPFLAQPFATIVFGLDGSRIR